MSTKYNITISLQWIFMLLATFDTISVEGLQALNKNLYGPKPKGTVKTIEAVECNDIIDCVDFYKQPAFDNPLIKMDPIPSPSVLFNETRDHLPQLLQTWQKYGECPEGTVPIRRTLARNGKFRRKNDDDDDDDQNEHEYATVEHTSQNAKGGRANFNVWNPRVEGPNEFSLSQIWVGSGDDDVLNTVEAGWMVYPDDFEDSKTRLFTEWTSDGYKKTGCRNHRCSGFVQASSEISLGAAFDLISIIDGKQSYIPISFSLDNERKWWLRVNNLKVGYYPPTIFTTLGDGADSIEFGGEIINSFKNKTRHTTTEMGSGRFASEELNKASFISNIKVRNGNSGWVDPELQVKGLTQPYCYNVKFGPPGTILGTHFYFGGPGFNFRCK